MDQEHPNLAVIARFDPADIDGSVDAFAEDVVFHYFNPRLPDVQGDYVGSAGIRSFFEKIGQLSQGTFRVQPVSATPVGDELVVVQTRNSMVLDAEVISFDVVIVFRVVEDRISEVWDIPSVFSAGSPES